MAEALFVTKKIVGQLCCPLGLSLLMILVGMAIWKLRPQKRLGFFLVLAGWGWLFVMSMPPTSHYLVKSLEQRAGPSVDPEELSHAGVKHIVVLGATVVQFGRTPAERWHRVGLLRLMEGIRLSQALPNTVLVLSGGSFRDSQSDADAIAELPVSLGIPKDRMILETRATTTEHEAQLFAPIVGDRPFALVTSAIHMPRAMAIFRRLGAHPLPCPCDFESSRPRPFYKWFIPDAEALCDSQQAVHEYLGLLWLHMRRLAYGGR